MWLLNPHRLNLPQNLEATALVGQRISSLLNQKGAESLTHKRLLYAQQAAPVVKAVRRLLPDRHPRLQLSNEPEPALLPPLANIEDVALQEPPRHALLAAGRPVVDSLAEDLLRQQRVIVGVCPLSVSARARDTAVRSSAALQLDSRSRSI